MASHAYVFVGCKRPGVSGPDNKVSMNRQKTIIANTFCLNKKEKHNKYLLIKQKRGNHIKYLLCKQQIVAMTLLFKQKGMCYHC